jgi:hypothetical protein
MTYDNTDTNADGTIEADIDATNANVEALEADDFVNSRKIVAKGPSNQTKYEPTANGLENAISDLRSAGAGVLDLTGVDSIDISNIATITIDFAPLTIKGAGFFGNTILDNNGGSGLAMEVTGGGVMTGNSRGLQIGELKFFGGNGGDLFKASDWHGHLENCMFDRPSNAPNAEFVDCFDLTVSNCRFEDAGGSGSPVVKVDEVNSSYNRLSFINGTVIAAKGSGTVGLLLTSNQNFIATKEVTFRDSLISSVEEDGILIEGVSGLTVDGCRFEKCGKAGLSGKAEIRNKADSDGNVGSGHTVGGSTELDGTNTDTDNAIRSDASPSVDTHRPVFKVMSITTLNHTSHAIDIDAAPVVVSPYVEFKSESTNPTVTSVGGAEVGDQANVRGDLWFRELSDPEANSPANITDGTPMWNSSDSNIIIARGGFWRSASRAEVSYTGNGTNSKQISFGFLPRYVSIVGSDGTIGFVSANGLDSKGDFGGDASLTTDTNTGNIVVDDGGSDVDPNRDGETYRLFVW